MSPRAPERTDSAPRALRGSWVILVRLVGLLSLVLAAVALGRLTDVRLNPC